ncbi:pyridoxamine 5'-phosphate oxidase family protein [Tissierella carlieri]|uniref:Pyridoxamine 5'-phosphate oxidase family protein n=1 Tax=Tissierella carlieri TaxID=689904 RepID=A0ABT1SAH4_9FIRM|nr:pyridoxamine 5'-phosphate oxidase family protein [uncultured Tissierella sp.]MBU5311712.1 pyridoxamine 5'-phosphate oxidase family protein [Tissierella carlieri]MCQ4923310.1 pyridoxamine 5'-phosphate oxidase family protein [Tissierella carlieri]MDU5080707.1 pyridoxamine 5'-phosphate oxidase family protein [Bacillota bacterium]
MNNKKVSAEELKIMIAEFLKEHKEGSLATCMNNIPRSSPVQYFVGDNMNIFILSAGGEKFNAIAENPNVCLLVNTDYINYRQIRGVQIFGTAVTSLMDNGIFGEAKDQYSDSYVMEKEKDIKVIKIVPEEIVYLDSLGDGDRTKQILRYNNVIIKEDREPIYL